MFFLSMGKEKSEGFRFGLRKGVEGRPSGRPSGRSKQNRTARGGPFKQHTVEADLERPLADRADQVIRSFSNQNTARSSHRAGQAERRHSGY
jgi:hypothetical protein